MKVLIIAEAGVNHNGDIHTAKRLIDAAAEAGADIVKFQSFKADKIVSCLASKAEYQIKAADNDETQYAMLKKLELGIAEHEELIKHCKKKGIEFLSTAFDLCGLTMLSAFGLQTIKIPSGEINNLPYLRQAGRIGKRIIISTGMADLGEIEDALNILIKAGISRDNITVLHCNTEYPTPYDDVNLLAMQTIRKAFKVKVGYSDHTPGIEVPVAAVALGASVIEKHFTLDRNMPGPDHKASLEPDELKAMVIAIRNIERAFGDGIKRTSPSELKNKAVARKSIFAAKPIKKGERLSEEMITTKRPGTGISPMKWDEIIGRVACKDFETDTLIEI